MILGRMRQSIIYGKKGKSGGLLSEEENNSEKRQTRVFSLAENVRGT
jgi:hypothetical protein